MVVAKHIKASNVPAYVNNALALCQNECILSELGAIFARAGLTRYCVVISTVATGDADGWWDASLMKSSRLAVLQCTSDRTAVQDDSAGRRCW